MEALQIREKPVKRPLIGKVKSPLNYIGGKYKLLPQILPLFPENIDCFIDLFTGGCNVGINANAGKIICNDNLLYLINLYKEFQIRSLQEIRNHIQNRIAEFELSITNEAGYKKMRNYYNSSQYPLDLFVLIAYSFNHQIRFNNSHEFNNPFGKNRSSFNASMEYNLVRFIDKLQSMNIIFTCCNFDRFNFEILKQDDFVYADPPYLITTGTYNDGKRGFTGWGENEERKLLNILEKLTDKGVKFALSNVLKHKGNENRLLESWVKKNGYHITHLDMNYANSNYQTSNRDKSSSSEVLITNYKPDNRKPKLLF